MKTSALLSAPLLLLCFVSGALLAAPQAPEAPEAPEAAQGPSGYILGPGDQISIRAVNAEEISNLPLRIDMSGHFRIPMAGRVKASGLTVAQLETEIARRLREFINEPEVVVSIVEYRSQPVSVLGAVKNPGVHQLQGRKTLVEMLSLAGGLADEAGHSVKVARRLEFGAIPLPNATLDEAGEFSVAQVSLRAIMEARNPAENIVICPHDVITVPRADMVYVIGQVMRSGGFVLKERESLSVLQALSLAGGLDRAASPHHSKILRPAKGAESRTEIAVNLRKILSGEASDVPLQPEDILFIPSSTSKKVLSRAAEAAIHVGTGIAIWRR